MPRKRDESVLDCVDDQPCLESMMRATTPLWLLVWTVALPTLADDGDWELRKDDDGIRVWTRPVPGSALDEFRGQTEYQVTLHDLVVVMRDADKLVSWMPDCKASRLIERNNGEQWHYMQTDLPWPAKDRDGVYRTTYLAQADGSVKVLIEGVPDYLPKTDGLIRIGGAEGFWMLEPAGDTVRVTYQLHVDPGGSLPAWLVNQEVIAQPYKTLKALGEQLALAQAD